VLGGYHKYSWGFTGYHLGISNPSGYHHEWYPDLKLDHPFSLLWKLNGENRLGKKKQNTKNWVRSDPLPRSGSQGASNVDLGLGWRHQIPTATSCKPLIFFNEREISPLLFPLGCFPHWLLSFVSWGMFLFELIILSFVRVFFPPLLLSFFCHLRVLLCLHVSFCFHALMLLLHLHVTFMPCYCLHACYCFHRCYLCAFTPC